MKTIDQVIHNSLTEFTEFVFSHEWRGKEREAVSLYAFGFLIKQCHFDSILKDPAQIGIEVRLKKPENRGVKQEICKDLVIWSEPAATCWDESKYPIAILEWKANIDSIHEYDVNWLKEFSTKRQHFTGYAITLDLQQRNFQISCTRIHNRTVQSDWLTIQ